VYISVYPSASTIDFLHNWHRRKKFPQK